jgi:hypothetical protein
MPILLSALLAACSDEPAETHGDTEPDVDAEACEHMSEGPYNDVTAAADSATAPSVDAEHTAHRIALPATTGGNGGYVSFASGAAGDIIFFLDADVPLAIEDASGAAVPIEESCDPAACSTSCTLLAGRHVVELAVGTYYLLLGPSSSAAVALSHEQAAGHQNE